MPSAASADEPVAPLHGVMTGLANLVNEHLGHLTIGPQATRFLRHLERQTFGNAGLHRRAGRQDPGLWCPYAHAELAQALELSSSALTHLRTRLVEAGIIWYTPDPDRRGEGAVGWSFDFASWRPPHWGGARTGAGRPRASSSAGQVAPVAHARRAEPVVALPEAEGAATAPHRHRRKMRPRLPLGTTTTMALCGVDPAIQEVNSGDVAAPSSAFKMSTSRIQDVNEIKSRRQRAQIKMSTAQPAQPGPRQVSAARARSESLKKEQNQRRRTDADASGVASTPPVAPAASGLPLSSLTHASLAERTHHAARRAQPPPQPRRAARAGAAADPLPPPLPYETLRSYWLRIYREASAATGAEARDLVHAAARALLNMGHERADYMLLAQLRQAAGTWATVLHWILACAARELADPRTYLRAVAARGRTALTAQGQTGRPLRRVRTKAARTGRGTDSCLDSPRSGGLDPPANAGGHGDADAFRPARRPDPAWTSASAPAVPQPVPSCQVRVPDDRVVERDGTEGDHSGDDGAGAGASSVESPAAGAHDASAFVADGAADPPDVSLPHIWRMAQQRLRADLTPAQYSTWMANTELYRQPDGALVLVTQTTFAAEHIAQRWGRHIEWLLRQIMGQAGPLAVRTRHLAGRPDG